MSADMKTASAAVTRRSWSIGLIGACVSIGALVSAVPMHSAGASPRVERSRSSPIVVVAAENFWGSIASQVGGRDVTVTSIITNPDTDPHEYEPSASDAREIATAGLVIVNGVGYDPWATKLLAADGGSPVVLNVGSTLGLTNGDNPHRWYNPQNVETIVTTLVNDLSRRAPGDRSVFEANAARFEGASLSTYHSLIATIRATYRGTPVGASESIFAMLAPALGLDLITPPSFLRAISEGTDVPAGDKATIDRQILDHKIAIYVYNSQNATPDIAAQIAECKKAGIPTATITETLDPADVSYETWQVTELRGILAALERARPR